MKPYLTSHEGVGVMRRVVVLGVSGSGKTTLARELARRMNVPHFELDALHWQPNWIPTPTEQLRPKVRAAIDAAPNGWTVCGHYPPVRDLIWPQADTLIWLDYPLTIILPRVVWRTVRRCWTGEELWNGNRELPWTTYCSLDSPFRWLLSTWRTRRRSYPKLLSQPQWRHLRIYRFRSPRQTAEWLARL